MGKEMFREKVREAFRESPLSAYDHRPSEVTEFVNLLENKVYGNETARLFGKVVFLIGLSVFLATIVILSFATSLYMGFIVVSGISMIIGEVVYLGFIN